MKNRNHTNVVCEHVCAHVGWLERGGILQLNEVTSMPEGEKGLCCGVSRPVVIGEMLMPTATQAGTPPNVPQLHHCSEPFRSP